MTASLKRHAASNRGTAVRRQVGAARWHFQHGPIDLLIDIDAHDAARDDAIADCWGAFPLILPALAAELPVLRRAAGAMPAMLGPVARRMRRACMPFAAERFITPMAAVAGAVADELIALLQRSGVRRASINNGGDIALYLTPGTRYRIGIWSQLERSWCVEAARAALDSVFAVEHALPVRGIATSGWRGRSFSLGIADSVTVLARDAASADAAATLIANAVNGDFEGIVRAPASELKDDSDLGERLVTVDVPSLSDESKRAALSCGRVEAERWRDRALIHAAVLMLQGAVEIVLPRVDRMAAMTQPLQPALA